MLVILPFLNFSWLVTFWTGCASKRDTFFEFVSCDDRTLFSFKVHCFYIFISHISLHLAVCLQKKFYSNQWHLFQFQPFFTTKVNALSFSSSPPICNSFDEFSVCLRKMPYFPIFHNKNAKCKIVFRCEFPLNVCLSHVVFCCHRVNW